MEHLKHWNKTIDEKNIVWLGLDRQDEAVNSINQAVLEELTILIDSLHEKAGLVIYSKKEKGFIAGADVNAFSQFKDSQQAMHFLQLGQQVFKKIESLAIPTVAMIDGFCMGGGLELALACDYRITSDDDKTLLGLPEVMLGIHPGWGGMIRLPKLIGGYSALSAMILSGRAIRARKAKALGVVDDVVPKRQLKRACVYFIENKPIKHKPSFMQACTNHSLVRPLLSKLIKRELDKRINNEHYPAPYAALKLWESQGAENTDNAYAREIHSVENLVMNHPTAMNLIRLFKLRESLKHAGKKSKFKAQKVHVIGAGIMGGDIAAWCALKGLSVTLQDKNFTQIAPAIKRAHKLFKKKLKKSRPIEAAMDNLMPDPQGLGIKHADVIIEAVFENLTVKQDIMQRVEKEAKKSAIIATNTSSIPLDEINTVMKNPERLVGIHYFNPVAKMELVEVVQGSQTKQELVDNAAAFVNQISRLPLIVRSKPGFLVNRVLMPYLMECIKLLEEGYKAETIDNAAKSFGMVMGPVEMADTVGLDVGLNVAKNLTEHFGGQVPKLLEDKVAQGKLGRKTGEGFYKYDKNSKPIKNKLTSTNEDNDIAQRLILRMINESAACLREEVVTNADDLDAGLVFGAGFAPFRGGPMHYARQYGMDKLNHVFDTLQLKHGKRFEKDAYLLKE